MTKRDERQGSDRDRRETPEPSPRRYVSYETDDGGIVIRDETDADAWIESDTVVELSDDEVDNDD